MQAVGGVLFPWSEAIPSLQEIQGNRDTTPLLLSMCLQEGFHGLLDVAWDWETRSLPEGEM